MAKRPSPTSLTDPAMRGGRKRYSAEAIAQAAGGKRKLKASGAPFIQGIKKSTRKMMNTRIGAEDDRINPKTGRPYHAGRGITEDGPGFKWWKHGNQTAGAGYAKRNPAPPGWPTRRVGRGPNGQRLVSGAPSPRRRPNPLEKAAPDALRRRPRLIGAGTRRGAGNVHTLQAPVSGGQPKRRNADPAMPAPKRWTAKRVNPLKAGKRYSGFGNDTVIPHGRKRTPR